MSADKKRAFIRNKLTERVADALGPIDFDQLLKDVEALFEAKKLRGDNPYVLHLIKVLWPYGAKGLRRVDVIYRVWQVPEATHLPTPKKFEHTVQSAYNHHSSHSSVFKGSPDDDLFYPVGGKGSGIWAVHMNKIEAWLKKKKLSAI